MSGHSVSHGTTSSTRREGELIPCCMSSTAPFYSSTTLSFTHSLSLSLPISPSTYISSSRFLVRGDHTSNLSHLFLHFRIFYHLLLVVVCGLPSLTNTVFHPAPPHRYFLLLNNTRVLFWMLPRFVGRFLYCVRVVVSIRFTVTVLRVRESSKSGPQKRRTSTSAC